MKSIFFCFILFFLWSDVGSAAPPGRIISLAPSVTEIICALGLERHLAGVTTYCDQPPSVRAKPKVGGPANPSLERIIALRPEVVVLDEEGLGPRLAGRLARLGIRTVVFRGARLSGLAGGIRRLGSDLGAPTEGERLAARIERALLPAKGKKPLPRALFIIWPDPLITAGSGTVIDDALRLAGYENIAAGGREPYPRLSLEAVMSRRPDIIIVGQGHVMGPPLEKLLRRLAPLEAVRKRRICLVDDSLYRSGPRIPEGIDELRRCARGYLARYGIK